MRYAAIMAPASILLPAPQGYTMIRSLEEMAQELEHVAVLDGPMERVAALGELMQQVAQLHGIPHRQIPRHQKKLAKRFRDLHSSCGNSLLTSPLLLRSA